MSLNGKRDGFTQEDLLSVGTLIGNFKQESKQIVDEVIAVVENWQNYANNAGVFDAFATEIAKNHRLSL